jgi:hypothetical protein
LATNVAVAVLSWEPGWRAFDGRGFGAVAGAAARRGADGAGTGDDGGAIGGTAAGVNGDDVVGAAALAGMPGAGIAPGTDAESGGAVLTGEVAPRLGAVEPRPGEVAPVPAVPPRRGRLP